jgi:coenzyme F420 hydrogenase subunit beta
MARATSREVLEKAQYGGVVTTLLCFLLEKGAVSSAVVTTREGLGTLARSKGEVISCGGSRYTASGTLWALNLALKQKERALAVVGLPCQIKAVRLMERAGVLQGVEVFKIGLFCTWAMALRGYRKILREEGVILSPIKCDIPPPPANVFVIHAIDKTIELPLEKMRKAIQKGCLICPDMTATYADISVGAAEGIEGFNTVITRTEIGGRILEMCIGEGLLKWEELPYQNLSHLKEASRIKMDRANSRLKEGNFR